MTELLWILTRLPLVLTAMIELPAPSNVTMTLDHTGYILRWVPGAGTPAGTSFSVTTKTISKQHKEIQVSGCKQVQNPLVCNMTEAFTDLTEIYDIQVRAHLGKRTSQAAVLKEYKPIARLPLPRLNVKPCSPNLCVDFLVPYKRLQETYNRIHYQLQIRSGGLGEVKDLTNPSLKTQIMTDLAPGREHCFSIRSADSVLNLTSDFSQPVCHSTSGIFSSDPVVSAVACLMVLAVIGVFALLFWTGFICLKGMPMPSVLTSIRHLEEARVSSCRASLSSLLNIRLVAPPVGRNSSSHLFTEDRDEESGTETSSRNSSGANYTLRPGSNLLSLSSPSSSLSSKCKPPPSSSSCSCSNQTPDSSVLQPEAPAAAETQAGAEQNPLRSDNLISVRTEEEENEREMVEQDVNLLTLTFGWPEKQNEEKDFPDVPEELSAPDLPLVLPSQPAAVASSWTSDDELQSYKDSEYMNRPSADVSERLMRFDRA
ncbi:hypothetical protein CHARACLAT_008322 [Characodon lateralis]|uniref:Uncharacterized protein n=1 Tax=Characodon lateralis TaxID=208331 RepID=A0ABU7D5S2_9TELE|nr:hypothetical protein [Characodon lateralis]